MLNNRGQSTLPARDSRGFDAKHWHWCNSWQLLIGTWGLGWSSSFDSLMILQRVNDSLASKTCRNIVILFPRSTLILNIEHLYVDTCIHLTHSIWMNVKSGDYSKCIWDVDQERSFGSNNDSFKKFENRERHIIFTPPLCWQGIFPVITQLLIQWLRPIDILWINCWINFSDPCRVDTPNRGNRHNHSSWMRWKTGELS